MSVIYKDGTYYGSGIDGHLIESGATTMPPREALNFTDMDLSDDAQEKQTVIKSHRLSSAEKTDIFSGTKPGNTLVDVVANPQGTPSETLNSIKIGNTIYELPSGGNFSSAFPFDSVWVLEPFAINGAINYTHWSNPSGPNWKYDAIDAGDLSGFVLCSVIGSNADGTAGGQVSVNSASFDPTTGYFGLNFSISASPYIFVVLYFNG